MRTIPAGFLDAAITDLQACWVVVRRDGIEILGTEHDVDITITTGDYAGTYLRHAGITGSDIRSTSDLSVDNLDVTGALSDNTGNDSSSGAAVLLDLNAADIEAGLLDNSEVTTFLVNSQDPDLYQHVMRTGWIGSITRTAEGQYKTELRGLTQALSQGIVRTYGVGCDAELGDARCTVNMAAFTTTGTVASAASRREFVYSTAGLEGFGQVPGGMITWILGDNENFSMEIKAHDAGTNTVTLYLPMPKDITAGDTFTFRAGCDKQHATCLSVYSNLVNFRGHAIFVPGQLELLKVGKR